ncbi:MAG TPA: hypothetical protein VEW03_10015 [Longimicrobiaceae bacterium]|nr:hypothetical protein [Longimicrobiaceae bacterium]
MIDELHPEPIDLSPLDPRRDRERWERMVARIVRGAVAPRTAWTVLAAWQRPALAAAALVAALSAGAMWWVADGRTSAPTDTLVEALEVPRPVADWIVEGRAPDGGDLYVALDELPSPRQP